MIATFALILAATNFLLIYGLHQLHTANERRIKALEARKPEPEKRVQAPVQEQEIRVTGYRQEPPKAGTVAAKAIQPVVYLSQVSHKTIVLDNGGLEWEGKI